MEYDHDGSQESSRHSSDADKLVVLHVADGCKLCARLTTTTERTKDVPGTLIETKQKVCGFKELDGGTGIVDVPAKYASCVSSQV